MGKKIEYDLLHCPHCGFESLDRSLDKLTCVNCGNFARLVGNKVMFLNLEENEIVDELDKLKFLLKKNHLLYSWLIKTISPICPSSVLKEFIKKHITEKDVVAINFGSGNSDVSPQISNADIFNYKNVDITCDILNIPLKDNSVDCVLNIAVLEHLTSPEGAVNEFHRILKKGGKIFVNFPFIQGFHSSPHDYSRRTSEGMTILFGNFEIETIGVAGGPTSGLLWILQEWLAILFSFGSSTLHRYLYIIFMVLTFPIKYLDLILKKHPNAKNITSNFYVIATKR